MACEILITFESTSRVDFSVRTDGVVRNYTADSIEPAIKKFVYAVSKGAGCKALNAFKKVATITNPDKKESLIEVLRSLL